MRKNRWYINLSGTTIPVYGGSNDFIQRGEQIGTISNNECFVYGGDYYTGWEGWGTPVHFINANHQMEMGAVDSLPANIVFFGDYASNGSSWIAQSALLRKVAYATQFYDSYGVPGDALPAGSYVTLDSTCVRGATHPNFIAVSGYRVAGKDYTYQDGFIDLTANNHWLNPASIVIRKSN